MSTYWAHLAGDTAKFAIRVELERDPHDGVGATVEEAASWGALQLWVDGVNLCEHVEGAHRVRSVHWYLLEFFEWLAAHWDALLHEERLPARIKGAGASESLKRTRFPPPAFAGEDERRWHSEWQAWWKSHCIQAARFGGLFPEVVLRRWRDEVEVSWAPTRVAGAVEDVQFLAGEGVFRLDANDAADVLYRSLDAVSQKLAEELPESKRFAALRAEVAALPAAERHWTRVGFLAGLARRVDVGVHELKQLGRAIRTSWTEAADQLFGTPEPGLVVSGACQAGLMFGSLSPTVSESDLLVIGTEMAKAHGSGGRTALYDALRDEAPPPPDLRRAWEEGYDLALEFREALLDAGVLNESDTKLDLSAIVDGLGVQSRQVRLSDLGIRAVAFCNSETGPTILVNSNAVRSGREEVERFTVAHELCHLLYDGSVAAELAIASGPWAPADIERRANAFAAMLLMPPELVERADRGSSSTRGTKAWVREIAAALGVSYTAAVEHLHNIGVIDEVDRDRLRPTR